MADQEKPKEEEPQVPTPATTDVESKPEDNKTSSGEAESKPCEEQSAPTVTEEKPTEASTPSVNEPSTEQPQPEKLEEVQPAAEAVPPVSEAETVTEEVKPPEDSAAPASVVVDTVPSEAPAEETKLQEDANQPHEEVKPSEDSATITASVADPVSNEVPAEENKLQEVEQKPLEEAKPPEVPEEAPAKETLLYDWKEDALTDMNKNVCLHDIVKPEAEVVSEDVKTPRDSTPTASMVAHTVSTEVLAKEDTPQGDADKPVEEVKPSEVSEELPAAKTEASNMATASYSIAFVSVPNETIGEAIAGGLVTAKLAACVNIIPGVKSIYEWDGKVQKGLEVILKIKTRTSRIQELTEFVKANNPYDVCQVITTAIEGGNPQYLEWVGKIVQEK